MQDNQTQEIDLKLNISQEKEEIVQDFFKDEFTHYTCIAWKDEQNYILVQNGVGYLIVTNGGVPRQHLNADSKHGNSKMNRQIHLSCLSGGVLLLVR